MNFYKTLVAIGALAAIGTFAAITARKHKKKHATLHVGDECACGGECSWGECSCGGNCNCDGECSCGTCDKCGDEEDTARHFHMPSRHRMMEDIDNQPFNVDSTEDSTTEEGTDIDEATDTFMRLMDEENS